MSVRTHPGDIELTFRREPDVSAVVAGQLAGDLRADAPVGAGDEGSVLHRPDPRERVSAASAH
jgi:hypothetical protein